MKKRTLLTIFVVVTAINNNSLCMKNQDKNIEQLALNYTTLKTCIDKNDMQCLAIYLQRGFNPNRYHREISLLHYAIQQNNPQAIKLLANANADLVIHNSLEQTPLDYAVILKYQKCIAAMVHAITKKRNHLVFDDAHCGLSKHIFKSGACAECMSALTWQLKLHDFNNSLTTPLSSDSNS